MSQFNFNMMDSAGYGFYRVWVERAYLLKLAMIPVMIKFACMITVMVLGYDDNVLRQGLILFPGILAEGWVLAQFLRTILKDERWPTILPPDIDDKVLDRLLLRARGIVAATLVYGLIALTVYVVRYLSFGLIMGDFNADNEDVAALITTMEDDTQNNKPLTNALYMLPAFGAVIALFWAFRLMWVYIPFSVLMPVRQYLSAIGGMMASVKMMVLYFCTMTPIMLVTIMISRLVFTTTSDMGDSGESVARFMILFVAVIAEILVALVSTAAFVWAMRDLLPKNPDLLTELPKTPMDR